MQTRTGLLPEQGPAVMGKPSIVFILPPPSLWPWPQPIPALGEGRQLSASPAPAPAGQGLSHLSPACLVQAPGWGPGRFFSTPGLCAQSLPPAGGRAGPAKDEATAALEGGGGNYKERSLGPLLRGLPTPGLRSLESGTFWLRGESLQAWRWHGGAGAERTAWLTISTEDISLGQ